MLWNKEAMTPTIISKLRNYALDLGFLENRPTDSTYTEEQREMDVRLLVEAVKRDVDEFLGEKKGYSFHTERDGRVV